MTRMGGREPREQPLKRLSRGFRVQLAQRITLTNKIAI